MLRTSLLLLSLLAGISVACRDAANDDSADPWFLGAWTVTDTVEDESSEAQQDGVRSRRTVFEFGPDGVLFEHVVEFGVSEGHWICGDDGVPRLFSGGSKIEGEREVASMALDADGVATLLVKDPDGSDRSRRMERCPVPPPNPVVGVYELVGRERRIHIRPDGSDRRGKTGEFVMESPEWWQFNRDGTLAIWTQWAVANSSVRFEFKGDALVEEASTGWGHKPGDSPTYVWERVPTAERAAAR